MKVKGLLIVSLILAALMAGFAFYAAAQVPPGTQLPVHWNAAGEVNGTLPAIRALMMPVAVLLVCTVFFALIPRLEPLQERLEGSAEVLRITWIGFMMIALMMQAAVAAPAFGLKMPVTLPILAVGLFLILIGNVLPKSRPGFFIGIRTPWAIMDTDNWIATHRLGGKLMMLAGLAIALSALLPLGRDARIATMAGSVAIAAVPPFVYSWWLWHRQKTRGQSTIDR
jgi:immunity protein, SdpI family